MSTFNNSVGKLFFVLIGFKLLYVPFEFAFNAQLIDIASTGSSLEEIHGLEFFGRTISSLAISLVVFRILLNRAKTNNITFFKLFGPTTVAFLISFFGQKALILSIVNNSSGEQRRIAVLLNYLPAAARYTHVEGFEFSNFDSPEAKTFLAESGVMLFFSKATYGFIEDQLDKLIQGQLIRDMLKEENDSPWKSYINLRSELKDAYQIYKKFRDSVRENNVSVENANQRLTELIGEAGHTWQMSNDRIRSATSSDSIQQTYDHLRFYFLHKGRPHAEGEYHKEMMESFGMDVEDSYWCSNLQCPVDRGKIPERIKGLIAENVLRNTGIDPRQPFNVNSKSTENFIRKASQEAGIALPDSWTITDREGFSQAFLIAAKHSVQNSLDPALSELIGESLWQDLSFSEFEQLPKLQEKMRMALEKHIEVSDPAEKISVQWDRATFEDRLIFRQIENEARKIKTETLGLPESYGFSGSKEKTGQDAIKRIIIPPISLTLSSFFAIFNAISLLTLLAEIPGWTSKRLSGAVLLSAAFLIIMLPFLGKIGLAQYSGYGLAMGNAEKNIPEIALIMGWNLRLQPVLYPVASFVRNHSIEKDFFSINEPIYNLIDGIDHAVFD